MQYIREVKHEGYGKRQTAKMKLLLSVFISLYSFVFAVNNKTLLYFCVIYLRITRKEYKIIGNLCRVPSAVNVMLKLSINTGKRNLTSPEYPNTETDV